MSLQQVFLSVGRLRAILTETDTAITAAIIDKKGNAVKADNIEGLFRTLPIWVEITKYAEKRRKRVLNSELMLN